MTCPSCSEILQDGVCLRCSGSAGPQMSGAQPGYGAWLAEPSTSGGYGGGYPPPGHGPGYAQYPQPGMYGAAGPVPMPMYGPSGNDVAWSVCAHLSPLVGFGLIAPIVIYLVFKDSSAVVRHHAAQALNFQLTLLIALLVSFILVFVLVGFVLLFAVMIWGLIGAILGAVAAGRGEPYRYPLTIPIVR